VQGQDRAIGFSGIVQAEPVEPVELGTAVAPAEVSVDAETAAAAAAAAAATDVEADAVAVVGAVVPLYAPFLVQHGRPAAAGVPVVHQPFVPKWNGRNLHEKVTGFAVGDGDVEVALTTVAPIDQDGLILAPCVESFEKPQFPDTSWGSQKLHSSCMNQANYLQ